MTIPIFGPIFDLIGTGVQAFADHKKAKMQNKAILEQKKQDYIQKLSSDDESWNRLMAKASAESWKDEFWTIVLAIPAILAFFPGMDGVVLDGFVVLDQMPDWYRYALLVAIAAAFGFRQLAKRGWK